MWHVWKWQFSSLVPARWVYPSRWLDAQKPVTRVFVADFCRRDVKKSGKLEVLRWWVKWHPGENLGFMYMYTYIYIYMDIGNHNNPFVFWMGLKVAFFLIFESIQKEKDRWNALWMKHPKFYMLYDSPLSSQKEDLDLGHDPFFEGWFFCRILPLNPIIWEHICWELFIRHQTSNQW